MAAEEHPGALPGCTRQRPEPPVTPPPETRDRFVMPEPEELLCGELAAVRGELSRVDAKCATLTGLAGAAAAFLTTRIHTATPLLTRLLLAAAGIGLAAAAVLLLAGVLRPRTGTTGFRRWAAMNDQQ